VKRFIVGSVKGKGVVQEVRSDGAVRPLLTCEKESWAGVGAQVNGKQFQFNVKQNKGC